MRDEMAANLRVGRRAGRAGSPPVDPSTATSQVSARSRCARRCPGDLADAAIVYRLMTPVPDNWVPFVAVPAPGGGVELERRPLLHFRDDGTTDVTHSVGVLLNEGGHRLRLAEEEVPRRWRRRHLSALLQLAAHAGWRHRRFWIGRRKRAGNGARGGAACASTSPCRRAGSTRNRTSTVAFGDSLRDQPTAVGLSLKAT